jgi:SAM-dependent methyltransferase
MSLGTFDEAASTYDVQLNRALALTGEDKHYFAEQRIVHLARCLRAMAFEAREVLDFGCGTGGATPYLFKHLPTRSLCGLDVSKKSLEVAAAAYRQYAARFVELAAYRPAEQVDLAYCNGVFHHIQIPQRAEALGVVRAALRPGGLFAFWENNPWNPGTRYIMSRVAFDRDASTISPIEARRMLREAGFRALRTDFLFVFPAVLRRLRGLERHLAKLPLGGQYQVLCRKPGCNPISGLLEEARCPNHDRRPVLSQRAGRQPD